MGLDVGPCAASVEALAQSVAIVGAVSQKNLPLDKGIEHVGGAASVMRLAFGQLQIDRQALGVDERMNFGRQTAARATHATGSVVFFWALAAC